MIRLTPPLLLGSAGVATLAAWTMAPILPASPLAGNSPIRTFATRPAAWDGGRSIADIVEAVEPAVVAITVDQGVQPARTDTQPFGDEGPFSDFFRHFMAPSPFGQMPQQQRQALGSGFLVDDRGDILTNNHVVDGGMHITVEFSDKSIAEATLIGADPATDLALIHVDKRPRATPLDFAGSDKLRVGDPVIAIGDPYGVGQTVTSGVVSARGRSLGTSSYVDYIQTDAPINQGNSGGPLLDYSGYVVGVNSAIFSPSGGNVGIGFAIPANTAQQVVNALKSQGSVTRAYLGVGIQDVTPQIAAAIGLDKAEGAIVAQVDPSGPAAGKLRPGDVIVAFGGKPIIEARDLSISASRARIGQDATLRVNRGGSEQTITVRMARLTATGAQPNLDLGRSDEQAAPRLGITVAPLDNGSREQLGLPPDAGGALVTDTDMNGAGARAGLQPGDIIEQVGNQPVDNGRSLGRAIGEARNKTALLLVERHGQKLFLTVPLA